MRKFVIASVLVACMPVAARAQDSAPVLVPRNVVLPGGSVLPDAIAVNGLDAAIAEADTSMSAQAVELSDAYYTRLTIHRYGSYAILPLFGAQYYLGNKLINGTTNTHVKPVHKAVAYTIGGIFVVNTVTGVWNLIESRHEKEGRGRKLLHVGLMLAADAGFAYTGTLAKDASNGGPDQKDKHRNAALASMGLATAGVVVMWTR